MPKIPHFTGALIAALLVFANVSSHGATQYWTVNSGTPTTTNNSWTAATQGMVPFNWSGSSGGANTQYWAQNNNAVIEPNNPQIGIGGFGDGTVNVNNLTILNGATFNTNLADNTRRVMTIAGSGTGNFTLTQNVAPLPGFYTRIMMSGATAWNGTITLSGTISGDFSGLFFTNTTGVGTATKMNMQGGTVWLSDTLIGKTATVGEVSGTGLIKAYASGSNGNGARTLSINQTTTTTYSGLIQSGTNASDVVHLIKEGSGTLTLSNTNSYGNTTITAGTLLISNGAGSGSGSGTVDVKAQAAFGGTGRMAATVGNSLIVEGSGTLIGGNGITAAGSLTIAADVTLQDNSVIKLVLGPSQTHSSIARSSGTWIFDSDQAFALTILSGATAGFYDNIITGLAANPWGGGASFWTIVTPGVVGTFSFDGANVDLTLTTVPEPGTAGLFAAGLGLFSLLRGRRARSSAGMEKAA